MARDISWLQLERYRLGELGSMERAAVEAALSESETLRACDARISDDSTRRLPAIDWRAAERRRDTSFWATFLSFAPLVAAAACLLVFISVGRVVVDSSAVSGVKGSGLTMTLIRERGGEIIASPTMFTANDRFAVQVTCATNDVATFDLVAFQGDEIVFPWPTSETVSCGNNVRLPGSFRLSGNAPVRVCLVHGGVDRASLAQMVEPTLCVEVRPNNLGE